MKFNITFSIKYQRILVRSQMSGFMDRVTFQKQLSRGVPRKRCSENTQQIYRKTPMPKCDFIKVALQRD